MAFAPTPDGTLRSLAWLLALGIGARTLLRRPDAAGRAFAFWVLVWAGGVQLLLSLDAMAADDATAQVLYRASTYAVLFSSSAFLAVLVYAPLRARRANLLLAAVLGVPALFALAFAGQHAAFLREQLAPYAPANTPLMQVLFHPFVWSGFLAGMLGLAWRAPRLRGEARASALGLMAGLGLFAGDRFARTATAWVRDPASLGAGVEGAAYGLFMLAFGIAVLAMAWRARGPGAGQVTLAALLGLAAGATSIATYGVAQLGGGLSAGVALSALLGPVYTALLARGVLAAPREALVPAAAGRAAVLAEA